MDPVAYSVHVSMEAHAEAMDHAFALLDTPEASATKASQTLKKIIINRYLSLQLARLVSSDRAVLPSARARTGARALDRFQSYVAVQRDSREANAK